jgi:hypothetical protein
LADSTEAISRLKFGLQDFNILQTDDTLSILCTMVLTHAPYSDLESPKSIEDLSNRLTDCLHHQMSLNENIKYSSSTMAVIWRRLIDLFM